MRSIDGMPWLTSRCLGSEYRIVAEAEEQKIIEEAEWSSEKRGSKIIIGKEAIGIHGTVSPATE